MLGLSEIKKRNDEAAAKEAGEEKIKINYGVLCWDYPFLDHYFDTIKEAELYYHKKVKQEPHVGWRLYEYIGDDEENCLLSTEADDE